MGSSRKKVIVRTNNETTLAGYLSLTGITRENYIELLDLEGHIVPLRLFDLKMICYVRDFNPTDTDDPERLTRRSFLSRPRSAGLWLRITFAAGDSLEGLATLDRSLFDGIMDDRGVFFIPPDVRSNTQRVFVPHAAIVELQILAVVTSPSKAKRTRAQVPDVNSAARQEELFTSDR